MTRKNNTEADERIDRSDESDSCPDSIKDKAREILKYDNPEQASDSGIRAHNQDYDRTQSETNHLIRTDTVWIAVRTWNEADGETGLAVENHGTELQLEWLKFDLDPVVDHLRSEALDAIDAHETFEHQVEPFTTLLRHDVEVTRDLVSEWGPSAEMTLRAYLTEGVARWTGRVAWTDEHVQDINDCAYRVATRFIDEQVACDVNDGVKTAIHRICDRVLHEAVDEHRDQQTRGLIYAAEVELTD